MHLAESGDPTALSAALRERFAERVGEPPTVVGRAPGRVNLIGEHTDYNAGLCLPVALPHATYAAARARADDRVRVASLQQDDGWEGTLDEAASAPGWAGYAAGVLWALREAGHAVPGVDLVVDSRVPLGAGLSSSAALECAVGAAAAGLLGLDLADEGVREALVAAGMRAETEVVGAPTGGMDQTVAVRGEAGHALLIDFGPGGGTTQVPLDLAGHTLLVTDTRVSHELVDGGYAARRADCEAAAAALGLDTLREATLEPVETLDDERVRRRATHIVTEIARVTATVAALEAGDWAEVGRLFDASHASMRDDFEISCPELDVAVAVAVEAGAVAARMTGGGFGGSSVAVVADERVDAVVRAVDAAFVREGFRSPVHLRAVPSDGAALV
ncbi:galactokinase [Nocardioides flavescens]|uniref:Galactokinase n=1 Tax=Nocardioides flavescens TaxID=2691959 RepID=A0A6L7F1E2_9ACTN|nr:galactokinase [Nocardioides flavescens]